MGIIFLLLSIITSSFIVLYFKYIERFRYPLSPVIAVNYLTCVLCGAIHSPEFVENIASVDSSIVLFGTVLGGLFIGIFFCIGYLTQKAGAGFVAILSKMCVVIPVLFSVFYFGEKIGGWNILGVGFALLSILLIQFKKGDPSDSGIKISLPFALFSALVFFGSGAIDTALKVFDVYYSHQLSESNFMMLVFGSAAIIGVGVLLYMYLRRIISFSMASLFAGVFLGVLNYFSILFLLKTLNYMQASLFFPLNNIGMVLTVCLLGILLYKECYTPLNYIGIVLAFASIILLSI